MDTLQTTIEITKLAIERDANFTISTSSAEKLVKFMQMVKATLDDLAPPTEHL